MSEDQHRPTLTVPQHALSVYLNSLLSESVPAAVPAPAPEPPVVELSATSGQEAAVVEHEPRVAAFATGATVEVPAAVPDSDVAEAPRDEIFLPTESFQALFLQVGDLNLAVPLAKLNGILKREDLHITRVPGYAPWHLGLIRAQGITTNLLDTASLLLPQDRPGMAEPAREYPYFILIDDKYWALGCHSLANVTALKPQEVKWRASRTVRPWLAGTVIEKTCVILDIDGLIRSLALHKAP